MKTSTLSLLFALGFLINTNLFAVVTATKTAPEIVAPVSDLSMTELESLLGRKIEVAEWFAFKLSNKKSHNNIKHYSEKETGQGFELTGFIMSILGLASFSFMFALLGVVFSAIALRRIKHSGYYGDQGFTITGLALGIIGLLSTMAVGGYALVAVM